jgi:hypothetical protein
MHYLDPIGETARQLQAIRRVITRRPVVASLLASAFLGGVAAPAIAGERSPETPVTGAPPPSERGTSLLRASGDEKMITLRLACHDDGTISIVATAPKRRLGSTRFACVGNRAVARLRMPAAAARGARARGSISAVATVVSGGERSRWELDTPRRGAKNPLARSSTVYPAWCTGVGFTMSMDNTSRYGAAWTETVWWRPVGLEVDLYTGARTLRYMSTWKTHRAVPGDGMYLVYPDGRFEFTWTVMQSARYDVSRYGVGVHPWYQVYTARGGYQLFPLGATSGYGYGETAVTRCDVPYPAGY